MPEQPRYAMNVGNIGQPELDLLECLVRIDAGMALDPRADAMCDRLIEAGLVREDGDALTLTAAGVERCRSLQHRVAGDKAAAAELARRGVELSIGREP